MKSQKNEIITLILSVFFGLIGLMGIGHFYARNIRGVAFLVAGLVIISIIGSIAVTEQGRFSLYWLPVTILSGEYNALGNVVIFFILIYLGLYFMQIYDSIKTCRQYNLTKNVRLGIVNVSENMRLMPRKDKIKLVVPLAILIVIGTSVGYSMYEQNEKAKIVEQTRREIDQNKQLERSTPVYAENYQKWRDCIQKTDGVYSHGSGMGYCGEDMQQPIYPTVPQAQQTQQVQQVNLTSNPSGATAVLSTNLGEIKIRLLDNVAPKTVANFEKLANSSFYDGTVFHRIVPGFVIQGGDPNTIKNPRNTWGLGDAGYTIPPEFSSSLKFTKYMVGMARGSDVNSGSSQFFITLGDAPWLNDQYTLFGEVISGQNVVDKIASIKIDPATDQPLDPDEVRIIKIVIHVE